MKRRIRFTRKVIDNLPPCPPEHGGKELEYTSLEAPPGLRLVVSKRGVKSWLLRYSMPTSAGSSKKRSVKIGAYPGMEPAEAISTSLELRGQIAKGIDPQDVRKEIERNDITLDRFFRDEYFPNAQSLRNAKGVERVWQLHISPVFGHLRFNELKTADIVRFHDRKRAERCAATANRILAVLKRVVNVGMLLERCDRNPCRGVRMHDEQNVRTRTLSGDELKRFIASLAVEKSRVIADFLMFALATAARRDEVLKATWGEMFVPDGVWRLPACRAKSGKSRVIPLNDIAIKVLESRAAFGKEGYIFPGRKGTPIANPAAAFERVIKRAGISDLRIHDLRRSAATLLINDGGGSMTQAGNLLGHAPGSSLTATRYAFLGDEKLFDASRRLNSAIAAACEASE